MAQMGTDEVCHAEATAFIEGSSGCVFKKIFFFFKERNYKAFTLWKNKQKHKGGKKTR